MGAVSVLMSQTVAATSVHRVMPSEQGGDTVPLRATLNRQIPIVSYVGTRAVLLQMYRTIPTAIGNVEESSEQGSYTVQLCATLDRKTPFMM